jgi:hypothetical protein
VASSGWTSLYRQRRAAQADDAQLLVRRSVRQQALLRRLQDAAHCWPYRLKRAPTPRQGLDLRCLLGLYGTQALAVPPTRAVPCAGFRGTVPSNGANGDVMHAGSRVSFPSLFCFSQNCSGQNLPTPIVRTSVCCRSPSTSPYRGVIRGRRSSAKAPATRTRGATTRAFPVGGARRLGAAPKTATDDVRAVYASAGGAERLRTPQWSLDPIVGEAAAMGPRTRTPRDARLLRRGRQVLPHCPVVGVMCSAQSPLDSTREFGHPRALCFRPPTDFLGGSTEDPDA